jgi:amino acid adenylation domain-containing protein
MYHSRRHSQWLPPLCRLSPSHPPPSSVMPRSESLPPHSTDLSMKWNATSVAYPRDASIHSLFAEQVARTPDAVAVEFEGARLTYRELEARANQLAHHLVARGVTPGARVGLCVERSLEMVVGILGILKAGAAYVPLDPAYPHERLSFMLEDTRMALLLLQERMRAKLPPHRAEVVCLDTGWEEISTRPATPLLRDTPAEALAYIMYTSGSTGRPKGVCIPHRGVVRLVMGTTYARLGAQEVFLQIASSSFDASTFELWGCLLHGGRLVVAPARTPSLEELARLLAQHGVTTLWLTAALFEQMVATHPEALGRVRQVLAGGDVLSPVRVREHLARSGLLVNGYGPTEVTTFTCCHVMTDPAQVGQSVSIGRPIANTCVYLLDEHLRLVPQGEPGELYAGGDGLAWGYLDRPDLTAERFIPHPFSDTPGARLYRTGDLAKLLPDGTLQFLGRSDSQVKVRGFRVEPGEIESALLRHADVREAVVVVRGTGTEDKRLVAYVVPRSGRTLEPQVLRDFLRASLPEYMVPSAVVPLTEMPLSPNGKVDRKALPAPESVRAKAGRQRQRTPPRTPTERKLAELWRQVLGQLEFGVDDNFFDLGGHSMLATQLIFLIQEDFGEELSLEVIFEEPTIARLARHLDSLSPASPTEASQPPPLARVPRDRALPLSFAQERLWRLFKLDPSSAAYNVHLVMRVYGPLDACALARAFQALIQRHESLRTTFHEEEGRPVQRVRDSVDFKLSLVPLARGGDHTEAVARQVRQPFDLTTGPLVRAELLLLGEQEHMLVFCMHHISTDGWSMGVLTRELAAFYEAFSQGRKPVLPELPLQYPDYATWLRGWLQGEVLEERLGYWKEALAGAPPLLALPLDKPRPPTRTFRGLSLPVSLGRQRSEALQALCRQEGVTPFMALLAVFGALLAHHARQEEVVLGSPIANRPHSELEGLIGLFVNGLALRVSLRGGPSYRELLRRVREVTLGAYAHQEVPFDPVVVDALGVERRPDRTPLYQVMFAMQNAPGESLRLPGTTFIQEPAERGASIYEMGLSLWETPEGFSGSLEYNTDLFETASRERLVADLLRLLDTVLAEPDRRLGLDSGLLAGTERLKGVR